MQQVAFRRYKRAFGIKVNSAAQVRLFSVLYNWSVNSESDFKEALRYESLGLINV